MASQPEVKIYHASEFEQKIVQKIVRAVNNAIAERGTCLVALAGGETPKLVYRSLGTPPLRDRVNWKAVQLFFTDERDVPPDHPESNYGMVHRELISNIPIPPANVHRIAGEQKTTLAASEYESGLKHLSGGDKNIVRFDLVLLGVGEDGHTASIFPETTAVEEEHALVAAVFVPTFQRWRITLTLPIINRAREIFFLVTGEKKAAIVQRLLASPEPMNNLPATLVRPADGKLFWMLDDEAASKLHSVA